MDKRRRPVPYPPGSEARRKAIDFRMRLGKSYRAALAQIVEANRRARNTPVRDERCEARTRRATACQCKALANGRCRLHGGLATGPKTVEGKKRAAANLRRSERPASV